MTTPCFQKKSHLISITYEIQLGKHLSVLIQQGLSYLILSLVLFKENKSV